MRVYAKEHACGFRFYSGISVIPESRLTVAETGLYAQSLPE